MSLCCVSCPRSQGESTIAWSSRVKSSLSYEKYTQRLWRRFYPKSFKAFGFTLDQAHAIASKQLALLQDRATAMLGSQSLSSKNIVWFDKNREERAAQLAELREGLYRIDKVFYELRGVRGGGGIVPLLHCLKPLERLNGEYKQGYPVRNLLTQEPLVMIQPHQRDEKSVEVFWQEMDYHRQFVEWGLPLTEIVLEDRDNDAVYMRAVHGDTRVLRVDSKKKWDDARVIEIASFLFKTAFEFLKRGYLFCDYKPDKLLLEEEGGSWRLYLTDLGSLTPFGHGKSYYGTPGYMAPEMKRTGNTLLTEVYAIGATLYGLRYGDFYNPSYQRHSRDALGLFIRGCCEADSRDRLGFREALARTEEMLQESRSSRIDQEEYLSEIEQELTSPESIRVVSQNSLWRV